MNMDTSLAIGPIAQTDRLTLGWASWPDPDREAWQAAVRKGDALDPGGPGEFWSVAMQRSIKMPYGRWLGFLAGNGLLNVAEPPALRVTPERMKAFVALLRGQIAPVTVSTYITHLYHGLSAMALEQDWAWLQNLKNALRSQARPIRDKRRLVVPSKELFQLGIDLMDGAETDPALTTLGRAAQFRDGLMIAMLAARPLRLGNFGTLRIGEELVHRGGCYWLVLPRMQTKSRAHLELPYPASLTECVDRYFQHYRRILATPHGRIKQASVTRPPANFMWVSAACSAMSDRMIYAHLIQRTRLRFGHSVNPHLFRDCVATTIAIEDPVHVGITQNLLGHTSPRTAELHYNHARSLEASRQYQGLLLDLRRQARKDWRGRPIRPGAEN